MLFLIACLSRWTGSNAAVRRPTHPCAPVPPPTLPPLCAPVPPSLPCSRTPDAVALFDHSPLHHEGLHQGAVSSLMSHRCSSMSTTQDLGFLASYREFSQQVYSQPAPQLSAAHISVLMPVFIHRARFYMQNVLVIYVCKVS